MVMMTKYKYRHGFYYDMIWNQIPVSLPPTLYLCRLYNRHFTSIFAQLTGEQSICGCCGCCFCLLFDISNGRISSLSHCPCPWVDVVLLTNESNLSHFNRIRFIVSQQVSNQFTRSNYAQIGQANFHWERRLHEQQQQHHEFVPFFVRQIASLTHSFIHWPVRCIQILSVHLIFLVATAISNRSLTHSRTTVFLHSQQNRYHKRHKQNTQTICRWQRIFSGF